MPDLLASDFFFIARRGYSREDAEDLTQDFFVRILKGIGFRKQIRLAGDSVPYCSSRFRIF